jgi:hypothetical protein
MVHADDQRRGVGTELRAGAAPGDDAADVARRTGRRVSQRTPQTRRPPLYMRANGPQDLPDGQNLLRTY